MSPTDLPPVPTEHTAEIIGDAWPKTSETGTVASVLDLFRQSAESVGTGNTAESMFALIEANATGQTPDNLMQGFTDDQRAAFDRSLRQLNMGQGASVMAQDILNTKVQLNGTVTTFEASVQELISSYASSGGPSSPKNQADFQKKYQELLDQAKQSAEKLGSNHTSTQDQLMSGVQKGAAPQVPSTMAPTSSSNPTVPGMPDGAMGSMLKNVAGQMMKPPNLPMPKLGQMMQPAMQSAQGAISELMKKAGGGGGVPITEDALAKLTKSSGFGEQGASLSGPRGSHGSGAESAAGPGSGLPRASLAGAHHAENARTAPAPAAGAADGHDADNGAVVETAATTPTGPATTAAPEHHAPTTTLSSGEAATGPDPLSSPTTHTSSGDSGVNAASLTPGSGAPVGAAPLAPMAPMTPMAPMMPPMSPGMGAGGGRGPGSGAGSRNPSGPGGLSPVGTAAPPVRFQPKTDQTPLELLDFGSDHKGLKHATDMQMVAASIVAGLVRMHDRAGLITQFAVGVSDSAAVFVTSDGLGFLPPGMSAAGHLTPLLTHVPDGFISRWLGCHQPWRPLLEAAGLGLVGPFDAVVATDPAAASQGVLVLGSDEVAAVNIAAGSQPRWSFDAVDSEDVHDALASLVSAWGPPRQSPLELEQLARQSRWSGQSGPGDYPARWARYLVACAAIDLAAGDEGDARYALRSALRIPEPLAVRGRR